MSTLRRHGLFLKGGAAASSLLTGLVSYYKLDDVAGNAIDSTGTNPGTVVGATQGAAGKIGTAYSFDGNDYINIDNAVNDLAATTAGTWAAWVKPTDATPVILSEIMAFGDANANEILELAIYTDGTLRAYCADNGVGQFNLSTNSAVFSDGVWCHVMLGQDGVSPVLYINGVAVAQTFSAQYNKLAWFNILTGIDNGRIGCRNVNNAGNISFFNGSIDEVGIWSRALTPTEITELYNSGSGKTYPF